MARETLFSASEALVRRHRGSRYGDGRAARLHIADGIGRRARRARGVTIADVDRLALTATRCRERRHEKRRCGASREERGSMR